MPGKLTKPSWAELFFDLALIGAFLSFGSDFSKEKTWGAGAELALKLLLIVWAWEQVTLFVNRFGDPFDSQEPRRALVYGIQLTGLLLLVSVVVVSVVESVKGNTMASVDDELSYAAAGVVLAVAILYELGGLWRPPLKALANRRRNAALVAAVFFLASAPLTGALSVASWVAGLTAVLLATLGPGLGETLHRVPINRDHFSERLALFVLILIGEVFVKNVVTSHTVDQATTDVLQLGFVAVICWMIWTTYQHEILVHGTPERAGALRGWSAGHYLRSFALIVASVGLVWYVTPDRATPVGDWIAMIACGGTGLAMLAIALIRLARGGDHARGAAGRILLIALVAFAGQPDQGDRQHGQARAAAGDHGDPVAHRGRAVRGHVPDQAH
ncbi:MAG: low temperature requirement protein A, partial [Solirubrobacterales bacterium]